MVNSEIKIILVVLNHKIMKVNHKFLKELREGMHQHFDVTLFRLTPWERIARYGKDSVAELMKMSITERVRVYGRDYEDYLAEFNKTSK